MASQHTFEVLSFRELCEREDEAFRQRINTGWGKSPDLWVFDPEDLTLTTTAGGYAYPLPLGEMTTSAQVLDWIFQIRGKAWASPTLVKALLDALSDLLHPQRNLCSWGSERGPIDARKTLAEIDTRTALRETA